jgi:hypothetical protein
MTVLSRGKQMRLGEFAHLLKDLSLSPVPQSFSSPSFRHTMPCAAGFNKPGCTL